MAVGAVIGTIGGIALSTLLPVAIDQIIKADATKKAEKEFKKSALEIKNASLKNNQSETPRNNLLDNQQSDKKNIAQSTDQVDNILNKFANTDEYDKMVSENYHGGRVNRYFKGGKVDGVIIKGRTRGKVL